MADCGAGAVDKGDGLSGRKEFDRRVSRDAHFTHVRKRRPSKLGNCQAILDKPYPQKANFMRAYPTCSHTHTRL